jgi:hypothetical protein
LLIPVGLPHRHDPNPIFLPVDPNACYDFAAKQPIGNPSLLAIVEAVIGLRGALAQEQLASVREIEPSVSKNSFALRRVEFDFHIIIVYTIILKSQGRSRFTPPPSSARAWPNVR